MKRLSCLRKKENRFFIFSSNINNQIGNISCFASVSEKGYYICVPTEEALNASLLRDRSLKESRLIRMAPSPSVRRASNKK